MKTTGRASYFDQLNEDPSKPFLEDLQTDLKNIDAYNTKSQSIEIKKKMIESILKSI